MTIGRTNINQVIALMKIQWLNLFYTDQDGKKLPANDLKVKFIYERHDYYWRWSSSNGWESGYNEKICKWMSKQSRLQKMACKVAFPVEGLLSYRSCRS